MRGREQFLLILGGGAALLCLLFVLVGYEQTWKLWGIPAMSPHFGDARVILSGAESLALGHDPLVNNPRDPWRRPMNYPRIWQLLLPPGLNQDHTTSLGLLFIALFVAGLAMFARGVNGPALWLLAACVFSPAVLFGVERANNDLAMFFLLSAAVFLVPRRRAAALALIVAAGLLKLFPILGLCVFLRESRHTFSRLFTAGAAAMLVYILLTWDDIGRIREATPASFRMTYGVNVFIMSLQYHYPRVQGLPALPLWSYVPVLGAALCAALLGRRVRRLPPLAVDGLDAFRVGSAIYIGSFLLLNNWDYRLIFLLFTIPFLTRCAALTAHPLRWAARITLAAIVVACWSLELRNMALYYQPAMALWFLVDQAAKWVAFGGLLCVFTCTLPAWIFPGTAAVEECPAP